MKDSGACGEYTSCAILAIHIIIGAIFFQRSNIQCLAKVVNYRYQSLMVLVSELPIFQSDAQFQHERVFSSLHLVQLFNTRDKLTFGIENVFAYACHDHTNDCATDGDDSNAMFSRYDTTPLKNVENGLTEYEKGQDCGVVNYVLLQATHFFALQFLSFCYILHYVSHVMDTTIWKIQLSRVRGSKIKVDGVSGSDVLNFNQNEMLVTFSCGSSIRLSSFPNT